MKQATSLLSSIFVAGLLVAGAATAQTTPQPLPPGDSVGNSKTQRPDGTGMVSRDATKADARAAAKMPNTNGTQAGDTNTVGGKTAEMTPKGTSGMTRAEKRAQTGKIAPRSGEQGMTSSSPTNPKNQSGAPN